MSRPKETVVISPLLRKYLEKKRRMELLMRSIQAGWTMKIALDRDYEPPRTEKELIRELEQRIAVYQILISGLMDKEREEEILSFYDD